LNRLQANRPKGLHSESLGPNLAVDVVAECADAFRSSYWTIRGAPKAITAMAHKLARLVYRMLKWGHEYVDKVFQ